MSEHLVIAGMKHCGKSTIAARLAGSLGRPFHDLDDAMAARHERSSGERMAIRELYGRLGQAGFRALEYSGSVELIEKLASSGRPAVIALGGGLADNPDALGLWRAAGLLILLELGEDELFRRIERSGLPPFLRGADPRADFHELFNRRMSAYREAARLRVAVDGLNPARAAAQVREAVEEYQARRSP